MPTFSKRPKRRFNGSSCRRVIPPTPQREGLKDYVKIYLEGEPHPILSLLSLKSLEEMLPEEQFIRVHRSFIVQGCKIKMIDRNRIVFGKEYIPISDTYKDSFAEFIARHSPLTGKSQN